MTTLMTQNQADTIRSVGEGAIVLWAMWVIDQNYPGRMTKAKELLPYLFPSYKDVRKLETQLNALCASGRLAQTSAGYVLLEGGKALFLEISGKDLALSPALVAGTEKDQALVVDVVSVDDEKFLPKNTREMRAPLVVGVNTTTDLNNDSLTTPTTRTTQNVSSLSLQEKILEESHILFDGDYVNKKGLSLQNLSASYLLSVLAYCYAFKRTDDRPSGFHSPAGMAHKMISENKSPRKQFLGNPKDHLPDEYLLAVGLLKIECSQCDEVFDDFEKYTKHREFMMRCQFSVNCNERFHSEDKAEEHHQWHIKEAHKNSDVPLLSTYTILEESSRGARAWKMVKEELQSDMPRASFDTWVRDAHAVGFESNKLTVAVRNAFARDWLESRIKNKINAMLEKFTNEKMNVLFVVGFVEGDE